MAILDNYDFSGNPSVRTPPKFMEALPTSFLHLHPTYPTNSLTSTESLRTVLTDVHLLLNHQSSMDLQRLIVSSHSHWMLDYNITAIATIAEELKGT